MGTYNAGYTYYYGRHVFTNAQCRQQPHSDRRSRKRGGGEPLLPLWRAHVRQPQHRPATLQIHRQRARPPHATDARTLTKDMENGDKRKSQVARLDFSVGIPGLEPGKAGPESAVLPLHHIPICIEQLPLAHLRLQR